MGVKDFDTTSGRKMRLECRIIYLSATCEQGLNESSTYEVATCCRRTVAEFGIFVLLVCSSSGDFPWTQENVQLANTKIGIFVSLVCPSSGNVPWTQESTQLADTKVSGRWPAPRSFQGSIYLEVNYLGSLTYAQLNRSVRTDPKN